MIVNHLMRSHSPPARATRPAVVVTAIFVVALAALRSAAADTRAHQQNCPAPLRAATDTGFSLLRRDSVEKARQTFTRILAACPTLGDAQVGLGFVRIRSGENAGADSIFRAALARDSSNADIWEGLAVVAQRSGNIQYAIDATRRVLTLAPRYESAVTRLEQLAPFANRDVPAKSSRRNTRLHLTMRTQGDRFEILADSQWRPFFVRGVNIGAAMPGKFPSEFPMDSAVYARWLQQIAGMNANAVRVYTILPPQFYRALRGWNTTNPTRPLHIIHGVWAELPPEDNFEDQAYNAEFRQEMRRVVDLLHGSAEIPRRPGHAGGQYDADVSPWTIGYITGREWESWSVNIYLERAPGIRSVNGRFLSLERGSAIDAWMVESADYMLAYEFDTYNALRPIAYTNWPTTDPLFHPTESSHEETMMWRGLYWERKPGEPLPHHEDNVSLDANLVKPTAQNTAGWFASYHAYPYYPDFIIYDPEYSRASSSRGPSNYFGYLRALREHHAGIPLMISEFAVPTSRGIAHMQPQGWHHGGLNEVDAAAINARLAADIHESGAAGEIFFAWIDEWFKANWFSADFEIPAENRRQWLNILSPEQHYGVIALRPGVAARTPSPGGDAALWRSLPALERGSLLGRNDTTVLRVGNDEGFVYLALESSAMRQREFPWDSLRLQLAIDTYRAGLGQMLLPESGLRSETGFEFLLELRGPGDAQLLVLPEYNPYMPDKLAGGNEFFGEHFRRPVLSRKRNDGRFDSLYNVTNRPRYTRDGRFIPASGFNLGRLQFGKGSVNSLADWYYDARAGMLQLRLPWGLLNVSDPSTRSILFESDTALAPDIRRSKCNPCSSLAGLASDGFRFAVVGLRNGQGVTGTLPSLSETGGGQFESKSFNTWTWKPWDVPTWHEYVKPTYAALRDLWAKWRE